MSEVPPYLGRVVLVVVVGGDRVDDRPQQRLPLRVRVLVILLGRLRLGFRVSGLGVSG